MRNPKRTNVTVTGSNDRHFRISRTIVDQHDFVVEIRQDQHRLQSVPQRARSIVGANDDGKTRPDFQLHSLPRSSDWRQDGRQSDGGRPRGAVRHRNTKGPVPVQTPTVIKPFIGKTENYLPGKSGSHHFHPRAGHNFGLPRRPI